MEKVVFMFRRKPGLTRDAYFDHYRTVHCRLGLRQKEGLSGYSVNHLESPADFDAVTEIWTPSLADFLDPAQNQSEEAREIVNDHMSFMGPQDAFAVDERVVRDGALSSPLDEATPGVKVISLHRSGSSLPAPDPGAFRVVDNVVTHAILLGDRLVDQASGLTIDIEVIRTSWFAPSDEPETLPSDAFLVREFRLRVPQA